MIELQNLSSDESFDDIVSSNISHSSSNSGVSLDKHSSNNIIYNSSNIKMLWRKELEKYVLVENQKVNLMKPSACWNRSGFCYLF